MKNGKREKKMVARTTTNPDRTRLQFVSRSDRTRDVLCEDGRSETVHCIVGFAHDIVVVVELAKYAHGPKDLFARDAHVRRHVSEDGGLDEEAFGPY